MAHQEGKRQSEPGTVGSPPVSSSAPAGRNTVWISRGSHRPGAGNGPQHPHLFRGNRHRILRSNPAATWSHPHHLIAGNGRSMVAGCCFGDGMLARTLAAHAGGRDGGCLQRRLPPREFRRVGGSHSNALAMDDARRRSSFVAGHLRARIYPRITALARCGPGRKEACAP